MTHSFDGGPKAPSSTCEPLTYREFLESEFQRVHGYVYRFAKAAAHATGRDEYFIHVFGKLPDLAITDLRRRKSLPEKYGSHRKPLQVWWAILGTALGRLRTDISRRKKELQFRSTADGSSCENIIKDDSRPCDFWATETAILRADLVASGMSTADVDILFTVEIEGTAQRELATSLGVPESTLSLRLSRIREQARKYFE